jgi:hypothetical protein
MTQPNVVQDLLDRIGELDRDAKAILSTHEAAVARVVTLEKSYSDLGALSLDQDELFRESLRAVEAGLFRAAHVLAWAGFIDFLHELLVPTHLAALQRALPKWALTSAEDLREHAEYQVIEAGKTIGAYNKTTMKALHGLLNKRNECAHPTGYFPDLNETLGFIGELFNRIKKLQPSLP